MELLPLLSHKIKVDRIILDGADILLETDNKGKGNWVFETRQRASTGTTTTAPGAGGEATSLPEIDSVQIRNSTVTYHDGVAGTTRSFKIDKLDADSNNGSLSIDLAALIGQAPLNVQGSVGAPDLFSARRALPHRSRVFQRRHTAQRSKAPSPMFRRCKGLPSMSRQGAMRFPI